MEKSSSLGGPPRPIWHLLGMLTVALIGTDLDLDVQDFSDFIALLQETFGFIQPVDMIRIWGGEKPTSCLSALIGKGSPSRSVYRVWDCS